MGIAVCKFCGQMKDINYDEIASKDIQKYGEDFNEYVTLQCDCDEAKTYQTRIAYFERAKRAIEEEFSEDYIKILPLETVQHIYDGKLEGITLKIDGENTVKISQDSKGKIFVIKLFSTGSKIQL